MQIAKGKPRVRVEQILPKRKSPIRSDDDGKVELPEAPELPTVGPDPSVDPVAALKAEKKRRRAAIEKQEDAAFWKSPEGRNLTAMLAEADEEYAEPAEEG